MQAGINSRNILTNRSHLQPVLAVQQQIALTGEDRMKHSTPTAVPGFLTVILACMIQSMPAAADTASDCRQEAIDYNIPEEQRQEYINGCMASRGELFTEDMTGMEETAQPEPDVQQESLTSDTETDQ